jgi:hypothetical protein
MHRIHGSFDVHAPSRLASKQTRLSQKHTEEAALHHYGSHALSSNASYAQSMLNSRKAQQYMKNRFQS